MTKNSIGNNKSNYSKEKDIKASSGEGILSENKNNKSLENFKNTVANMEFEEAFEKLQNISKKLDSGNISLSQTVKYLEYALILKSHCKKILESFKLKVEEIIISDKDKSNT